MPRKRLMNRHATIPLFLNVTYFQISPFCMVFSLNTGEFNSNTATPLVLRDSRETTVSVKMTNNVVTASSDDRLPISGGIHIVNSSAQINDSEFRSNIIAVPDEYSVGGGACINVGFLPENVSRHVIVSNSTFQACQVRLKHTTSAMRSFETYHGGGICVHFLPFVSRCKLSIIGCTFSECMAARGGALSVNFTEKASENEVTVTSSRTNRTVMKNNSATGKFVMDILLFCYPWIHFQ